MKTCQQLRVDKRLQLEDEDAKRSQVGSGDKMKDKQETLELAAQIGQLQTLLCANKKQSLLLVLQGMDTAGKDRCIASTFAACSLMGVKAYGFKAPSVREAAHDFLWRVHAQAPERGQIMVFNRSHYEDVLVPKVHGWISQEECNRRYAQIRAFETMLSENGTRILKVFLHISRVEQTERLRARLQDPQKQWKFDVKDLQERPFWAQYQAAYSAALQATDSNLAPWYVVPADSKTQRNLAVARLVAETLTDMQLDWPPFRSDLATTVLD